MDSKKSFFYVNVVFFLISFFGSIFQSYFIYDPFHWGLAQSSLELFEGSKPYKDIFIHYGFFYTLTNSIILKITNNDLIYIFFLSSLFYSLGNYYLCDLAYNKLKIRLTYFLPVILFLTHPFTNHPWYNYQFYFLIVISLYFLINNNKYSLLFFSFFLSLSCLVYENFTVPAIVIIFFLLFANRDLKNNIYLSMGFLLPQILFHSYLSLFELHEYWIKTFWLNEVFLKIYSTSFYDLMLNYINILIKKSILDFISEPYYFLFFMILMFNLFYLALILKKKFKSEKILKIEFYLLLISIICLFTFPSTLHKLNIFRFSTGPIIGIILIFYFLEKKFFTFKNYIVVLAIVILSSSTLVPIKKENNRFFPLFDEVKNNVNMDKIDYFRSQKWREETWKVINQINDTSKKIGLKCKNVNTFINYTKDAYVYMIAKKYIDSNQYIFWYQNEKYYKLLLNHFNVDMNLLLKNIQLLENGVIFFYLGDLNYFKTKINLNEFKIYEFPYSYQQKRIGLLIPNKCQSKIL